MSKLKIVIIPEGASTTKQFSMPRYIFKVVASIALIGTAGVTFLIVDYLNAIGAKAQVSQLQRENQGLKGEAQLLMANLDEVKRSLERVDNYSRKLQELTSIQFKKMSKATGIGPLTDAEYQKHQEIVNSEEVEHAYMPLGIDYQKLTFRPIFDRMKSLRTATYQNSFHLKQLLSRLSEKKSLLSCIPSLAPVNGWVTSGFGSRISPFTGQKVPHKGVDLASPIGTPIRAPADGVVIFSGAKAGFGNFVMIAHGNGVVSRYGHNAQNMVQPGQKIKRGEQIATVGMTGRTTGPHLHYEVLVNGIYVNPKKFILNL